MSSIDEGILHLQTKLKGELTPEDLRKFIDDAILGALARVEGGENYRVKIDIYKMVDEEDNG